MSFTYDDNGIRTSKTVNNVKHSYYLNGSLIVAEQWSDKLIVYLYDSTGMPIGMMYRTTSYAVDQWDVFWFEKNLQGDVVAIYSSNGIKVATYTYNDAWGNHTASYSNGGVSTGAYYNPFRYRGYYYDTDLGMYYLQSRYYDPNTCRFINADGYVSTGQGLTGYNMFAYCNNNPVNCVDPSGNAAYHWIIGAVIVAACAVATVVTCGGFAAAATAVCMVGSGVAAATTASTIAAAAFIGSATVYGSAVFLAASTSHSVDEFNDQGNWGTVVSTAFGGLAGGAYGYDMARAQLSSASQSQDTFLPDEYYSKNKAPKFSTPNTSNTTIHYKDYTGEYEVSTTYYDYAGRQSIRIDWTNHGYADHGNPHIHFTFYSKQFPDGYTIRWD